MSSRAADLIRFVQSRRSVRGFADRPVEPVHLLRCIETATTAPAPHHTRPWRFCVVETPDARERLATSMADAWRVDLERDGTSTKRIDALLTESVRRIVTAPGLVLLSITYDGARGFPDDTRATRERTLFAHSAGAAMQNVFLAAHAMGLAAYWISAPLYAPEAVRGALDLPSAWHPQALASIGWPDPAYRARSRPIDPDPEVR